MLLKVYECVNIIPNVCAFMVVSHINNNINTYSQYMSVYLENVQFQRADVFYGFYLHKNAYTMDAGSVLYSSTYIYIYTYMFTLCYINGIV